MVISARSCNLLRGDLKDVAIQHDQLRQVGDSAASTPVLPDQDIRAAQLLERGPGVRRGASP